MHPHRVGGVYWEGGAILPWGRAFRGSAICQSLNEPDPQKGKGAFGLTKSPVWVRNEYEAWRRDAAGENWTLKKKKYTHICYKKIFLRGKNELYVLLFILYK